MWATVVTAASPAPNTLGGKSIGTPLASASRALLPRTRKIVRPSDCSLTEARLANVARRRCSTVGPSSPSPIASHCPGPAQTKAIGPAMAHRGTWTSRSPKTSRRRPARASVWFLRTLTVASAGPLRRASVTPAWPSRLRCWLVTSSCSRPERGVSGNLDMHALSRRIDEAGGTDLRLNPVVAHGIRGNHTLADPVRATGKQSEPDPMPARRRERGRGDDAFVVLRRNSSIARDEMRSGTQALLWVDWLEADESRSVRIEQRRAICQHPPDVILLRGHHSSEAEIARCRPSFDLVAGHMPLLNPHHAQCLGTIGSNPECRPGLHERLR